MAIVEQDDKQNPDGTQDPSQTGGQASTQSALSPGASAPGSFSTSSTPVSGGSPGVSGAGGTNGWTNIQAYLNANQGNNSSANALNNQVGSAFNQDKQNLESSSAQAKQQAQAQVDQNNISQDKASSLIQDAGKNYSYGSGPQSSQYQGDIGQLTGALSAKYNGPTDYNYGLSQDTQNYGQALGNDQGFQGVMSALYNNAAGGSMGQGAMALQTQLDQDNPAVAQARQNLLSQYSGLTNEQNQTVADTQNAIKQAQSNFGDNQNSLKSYLNQMGTGDQSALNNQVQAYDNFIQNDINQLPALTGANQYSDWSYALNPNSGPNTGNVMGVDQQRNEWNSIQDVLGNAAGKINYAGPWDPNSMSFTRHDWGPGWPDQYSNNTLQQLEQSFNAPSVLNPLINLKNGLPQ